MDGGSILKGLMNFLCSLCFSVTFWPSYFAESVPLHSIDDEGDIEEEFRKLEAELQDEIPHIQVQEPMPHPNEESPDEVVESLSNNLSSIKLEAIYMLVFSLKSIWSVHSVT